MPKDRFIPGDGIIDTLGTRLIGSLPDDPKGLARDATCLIRLVS